MKIEIEEYYDGFSISVDGEDRVYINQEDSVEKLAYILQIINPEATITYEEVY